MSFPQLDWRPTTWSAVLIGITVAFMGGFGIALILAGESAEDREVGWLLLAGLPLVVIFVALTLGWIDGMIGSGKLVMGPHGYEVIRTEDWNPALGRRSFLLWYLGTALLACGAVLVAFLPWPGIGLILVACLFWLSARRTLRLALGLSRMEAMLLTPRTGHPFSLARRHEPGTWWSQWAWVDLTLQITAFVFLFVAT